MLNVAVTYLEEMQGQLEDIAKKLNALAKAVREIAEGVRLLLGRPVTASDPQAC